MHNVYLLISMPGAAELMIIAFILLSFLFWIICLVDIARSRFDSDGTKVVWIIVVTFLGLIGSLIYWFAGRPARVKTS